MSAPFRNLIRSIEIYLKLHEFEHFKKTQFLAKQMRKLVHEMFKLSPLIPKFGGPAEVTATFSHPFKLPSE